MPNLKTPAIRRREADMTSALENAALPDILKRIYAGRGITDPAELTLTLDQLLPPTRLSGIGEAADLLADAIEGEARVLIVGDFDADGATSSALTVLALRRCSRAGLRQRGVGDCDLQEQPRVVRAAPRDGGGASPGGG